MKVLVTGAGGQLGLALSRKLGNVHEVIRANRAMLDITDSASCEREISSTAPDVVINCAAYTAVDKAENDRDAAFASNATAAGNLARAARECGALLIHFSTDYVFNGVAPQTSNGARPCLETDATDPLGVYGQSKREGELAVMHAGGEHLIFRLSWVYSNDGANFYKTMLRLASERDQLRVVADQFGTPNFTGDLADAVAHVLSFSREALAARVGLYHLSASGVTSWHAFAEKIIAGAQLTRMPRVEPITTAQFPTPAVRPAYSALDASRFETTFAWTLPNWEAGLARCLAERRVSA